MRQGLHRNLGPAAADALGRPVGGRLHDHDPRSGGSSLWDSGAEDGVDGVAGPVRRDDDADGRPVVCARRVRQGGDQQRARGHPSPAARRTSWYLSRPWSTGPVNTWSPSLSTVSRRQCLATRSRSWEAMSMAQPSATIASTRSMHRGLERLVAHGEDLVDHQHPRIGVHDEGEAEAQAHAGGEGAQRRLQGLLAHACECDDVVEALPELTTGEADEHAADEQVLEPGQVPVEAGRQVDERRDGPVGGDGASSRRDDAGDRLEQGRLARSVLADHADDLPGIEGERHVPQRPAPLAPPGQTSPPARAVALPEPVDAHEGLHQRSFGSSRPALRNRARDATKNAADTRNISARCSGRETCW